jgi:hypothetical protein
MDRYLVVYSSSGRGGGLLFCLNSLEALEAIQWDKKSVMAQEGLARNIKLIIVANATFYRAVLVQ